jgi:hypothetical protein
MPKYEICHEVPSTYDRDRRERVQNAHVIEVPSPEFLQCKSTESGFLTVYVYGEDHAPTHVFGRVVSVWRIG